MAEGLVRQMGIGIGWEVDDSGLVEANDATDGLVDSTEEAESSMDGLSDAGEQSGSTLSRAFDGFTNKLNEGLDLLEDMKFKLAGVAAAGSAAILGAVNMAGDIEESLNTINREFGDASDAAIGFAEDYARATELTEAQTLDWTKTLGLNLRMLNLNSDEMAGMTEEIIEMTHNYAHFMDMDPQQAFNSIHQAIRGGRFPRALRDLTGQVRMTDIENRAMTMGLVEQGEEVDQQAERIATLSLLTEELSITQGAATAGQEEWNTRFTEFRGILGDITRDMGNIYLPTLSRGLNVTNGFLNALRENRLLKVAAGFAGLITVVAGLGAAIGFAKWGFATLVPYLTTTVSIFGLFSAPVWAVVAAIVGLGLVVEDLWVGFQGGDSVIFKTIKWFGEVLGITEELKSGFAGFKKGIINIWNSIIQFGSGIYSIFKGLGQIIWGFLTFNPDLMLSGLNELWEGIKDGFKGISNFIYSVGDGINKGINWIFWTSLKGLANIITGLRRNIFNSVSWIVENTWNLIMNKIGDWTGIQLPNISLPRWPDIKVYISDRWNDFKNWINSLSPVDTLKNAFNSFSNWLPELPEIKFSLSDIVTAISDFSPISWIKNRFSGFANWIPDKPDINLSLLDIVDTFLDFTPIGWLRSGFEGFAEWHPSLPSIDLSLSNIVSSIADFSPIGWLSDSFTGFREWRPSFPDINFSLSGIVDPIADFDPIGWISESFSGFSDWSPEFPDITGMISDWWGGIGEWVDENISFSGLLEGTADVAGGIKDTVGGWFGGSNGDDEVAEAEAQRTQNTTNKSNQINKKETNHYDIDINIDGEDLNEDQVAKKALQKFKTFLKQEAAEAGVE